ncbi:MAG: ATPase [Bacteroides sp.]|nr:ATPase [Bacteroides sp.]
MQRNPFVTNGYVAPQYFCDREVETEDITSLLLNGNNIALISPRRYGKTDLIRHCFLQSAVTEHYYTFIVDIYSTRSLSDLVNKLGKSILDVLKPRGRKVWEGFVNALSSLQSGISYDMSGTPSWNISLGDITNPLISLDEIFHYLQHADRPCLIAIDEFQQIGKYLEDTIEATLRTYVQYCSNARFIFSGSQRHLMGSIFTSPSRPFYQSVTIVNLQPIPKDKYTAFAIRHFRENGKDLLPEVVDVLYTRFRGGTFYLQKVMNILYSRTPVGGTCEPKMIDDCIDYIINFTADTYSELLYQLPDKQKQVLIAINREGQARNVTSGAFSKRHGLVSPSSVRSALAGLLDRDFITKERDYYQVYDLFFSIWLEREEY